MLTCPSCGADVLDVDVRCRACGGAVGPMLAHRMIGTTVLGHYKIEDVIGQGGMSVVFRARHLLTDQEVALKVLPPDLAAYSQVKSRFLEEARALAQLDHPNIVHLYNFGEENGSFVLAMQLVAGDTWERLIHIAGHQDWPTATRIAVDVLRGLEYAHGRGIVHRDMKPSNVLVRADDGTATVMDFGIAKMTTSTRLTATGQTMGTVRYMSPEQVRGHEVDARSDIYSFGVTLYEALVGRTPFEGETHFEIMTKHLSEELVLPSVCGVEVPKLLEAAVAKAMAKRAADRWSSARELRKELETLLDELDASGDGRPASESGAASARARARPTRNPVLGRRSPSPGSEPTVSAPVSDLVEVDNVTMVADVSSTDAMRMPSRRGRTLGLALGALVLVAAAGVGVFALRAKRSTSHTAAPNAPAARISAAAKEFRPTEVTWAASLERPEDGIVIRVAAPSQVSPAAVAATYQKVMATARRMKVVPVDLKYPERLTLQLVPSVLLCDPRTFDGAAPDDCSELEQYFRVSETTLLIANDPSHAARLEPILAEAVAEIVCIYNGVKPCFVAELIEAVRSAGG